MWDSVLTTVKNFFETFWEIPNWGQIRPGSLNGRKGPKRDLLSDRVTEGDHTEENRKRCYNLGNGNRRVLTVVE